jgi:hypothetical protein
LIFLSAGICFRLVNNTFALRENREVLKKIINKTRYMDKEEFNEKQIDALDNAVVIQTLSEELDKDIDELLRRFCLPDKYKMPVLTTVSARLIFQKGLLLGYPEGLEPVRQIFLYGLDKQLDQLMQTESKKNNE